MTTPPFPPFDPRIVFDDDPFDEARRQIEETARTAGHVGQDLAEGGLRQIKDEVQTLGDAGGHLAEGGKNAVMDYANGYGDAADDILHGKPLDAAGDVIVGNIKAAGDVLEGGAKAAGDLVEGGFKLAGDALDTAGDVAGDAATGAKHLLGIGGDDKDGTLKKVGAVDKGELEAGRNREKQARTRLTSIEHQLAQKNPAAFATADELLAPGEAGLQFFDWFLPAYRAWTGSDITTKQLKTRYEAEHGMRFDALVHDSRDIAMQGEKLDTVDNQLQAAYNQLVPHWQGAAASQFETMMTTFFGADRTVVSDFAKIAKGTSSLAMALERMVYAKANAVAGLYGETLSPGIDGVQARQTLVNVAKNEHCGDQQRRWVLGTFHQEMHGRHGWDDDTDTWSTDALDDNSRQHAQEVAANWCNQVLVTQVQRRLQLFDETLSRTTQGIRQIFQEFSAQLTAVTNPYAGMSASAPSDAPTTPQSSGPGGAGGGGASGGGASGGSGGSDGSGGGASGGSGGGAHPQVPIPNIGAPASGNNGSTAPTGAQPGTSGTGVPGLPAGTVPTNPADAPKTNPDGSVTFGPGHSLTLSRVNRDGSIDLAQKSANGTQKYHVTFGPNGVPKVTTVGADGAIVTPAGVRANADGSVTLDGDLTIGQDDNGHFLLTDTAAGTGGTHAYQVEYDDRGAPHVTDATQAGAGGYTDLAGAQAHGADVNTDLTAATPGADGASSAPGGSADFGSGGTGDSGGTAASGSAAGDGGGATSAAEGTGSQLGAANQYGAQTGAESAAGTSTAPAAAAAQQGSGHSGGFVGGMPPMGAGMGRGGGGGGDDLERRYSTRPESVLDDGDLEQWDRLGPTIG